MNVDNRIDELVNLIKECHRIYKEPCETCTQYSGKCGAYWELRYWITIKQRKDLLALIKIYMINSKTDTPKIINKVLENNKKSMEQVIADLLQDKEEK